MALTSIHSSRVHTGSDLEPAWQQLLDALARHGVLGCVGAVGAILDTGNPAIVGSPRTAPTVPARGGRR